MTVAPDRFEDRLLAELRQAVAARPAPVAPVRTRRTRRYALSGVGVAAATVVVAVVGFGSDATPSAYAVQSKPDGSVRVSINRLSDAAGLERSLQAAGVSAVVSYDAPDVRRCATIVPATPTIIGTAPAGTPAPTLEQAGTGPTTSTGPSTTDGPTNTKGPGAGVPAGAAVPAGAVTAAAVQVDGDSGAATLTIEPGQIPPGAKVVISTATGAVGSIGMLIAAPGSTSSACPLPAPSSASGSTTTSGSDS